MSAGSWWCLQAGCVLGWFGAVQRVSGLMGGWNTGLAAGLCARVWEPVYSLLHPISHMASAPPIIYLARLLFLVPHFYSGLGRLTILVPRIWSVLFSGSFFFLPF